MHYAAWEYVVKELERIGPRKRVLEIGSRDVNGSVRRLFNGAKYIGLDIEDGAGVDVVAYPRPFVIACPRQFDAVLCLEVLEHDPQPMETIRAARMALVDSGGVFILTAAGVGRIPHSAVDGAEVRENEHYENISRAALEGWLSESFGERFEVEEWGDRDIRAISWTGELDWKPTKEERAAWVKRLAGVTFPR
jgi:hypothetical protein